MSDRSENTALGLQAKLNNKMDDMARWHRKIALFHIVDNLSVTRAFIIVAVLVGLLAAFANFTIRQSQYDAWQASKQTTYLDNTPLFSTTDASYFVSLARHFDETGDVRDFDRTRLYPLYGQRADVSPPQDSLFDFPLFSVLIALFSPDSSTESLLKTGNGLIPLFGFITALGILLAFGAAGFWLEGAVAAVGAGLAPTFLMRSAIGRIDTDILNLGFFYAVLGLTIFAGKAKSMRAAVAWTIAAAMMYQLFSWWYDKAVFGWAFFVGLVWLTAMTSRSWQRAAIVGAVFLVLSGLGFLEFGVSSDSAYFKAARNTGALTFPNTFNTITELRTVPFEQILYSITGSFAIGLVGVFGLALFAVRHPVIAVVFGPASVFALASFLVGNRTIFYSAPMIWFGIAFLAVLLLRFAWRYVPQAIARYRDGEIVGVAFIIMVLIGGIYADYVRYPYVPSPSFPKDVIKGFEAADNKLPEGSVIATWWDYGYASHLFNGYNTLHDGGSQNTPVTHYVARAMVATSQSETHAILHNLAAEGLQAIYDKSESYEAVESHILTVDPAKNKPVFLVLTNQMGDWMTSISQLGMWDTKTGTAINAPYNQFGPRLFYQELQCQAGARADAPVCNGKVFDLSRGTIDNQIAFRQVTQAENGKITGRNALQEQGYNAIHLADVTGRGTRVLMMHNRLAQTSFHRLFHLGEADANLFELIYDDYPHMKIYALK